MFGVATVAATMPKAYADGGPFKPVADFVADIDSGILGVALEDGQAGEIITVSFHGANPMPRYRFSRDDSMSFDDVKGADQLKLVAGGLPIKLRGS